MALNLARLGTIQRTVPDNYDPFAEAQAARLAAQQQQQNQLNLAKLQRDAVAADKKAKEDAATRQVLGQYIQSRNVGQTAPVGVVNPSFLGKQAFGPQPENAPRDTSGLDAETVVNLSKINPVTAEQFRTGRMTEQNEAQDRQRKQEAEGRAVDAAAVATKLAQDKFEEDKRHNKADEYIKGITANKTGQANARDVSSLRSQLDRRAKTYLTVKDAYAQARQEYENYAKNPTGNDALANQQGIIDKYIIASTGKATTEAQFQNLIHSFPGLANYVNNVGGKAIVGRPLPNAMLNGLMRNIRGYTIAAGQNLSQSNDDFSTEAGYRNLDPRGMILTPNERINSDISEFGNYKYGNEENGVPLKRKGLLQNLGIGKPDEDVFPQFTQNFGSEAEAEAAKLPPGTVVTINGRRAVIE